MGFFHGSFVTVAFGVTFLAWLISNEVKPDPERVWHYVVFGAGFLVLAIYFLTQLFDREMASAFGSIQAGVALAFAAWFLVDTPYRELSQITWGYAAAFLVVPTAIAWFMDRRRGKTSCGSFPDTPATTTAPAHGPVPLSELGTLVWLCAGVVGLFMGLAYVTRTWGLLAAVGGFVLWPVTVLALPWYVGFTDQDWWSLAIVYGGGVIGWLLSRQGKSVTADD